MTQDNEIKCYECHFRCYCGKVKQDKAMRNNSCSEYKYFKGYKTGYSDWGDYFSTPGY